MGLSFGNRLPNQVPGVVLGEEGSGPVFAGWDPRGAWLLAGHFWFAAGRSTVLAHTRATWPLGEASVMGTENNKQHVFGR